MMPDTIFHDAFDNRDARVRLRLTVKRDGENNTFPLPFFLRYLNEHASV